MATQTQTAPNGVKDFLAAATICIPMALQVGTGGHSREQYVLLRKDAGYAPAKYIEAQTLPAVAVVRTTAQNLDHIRIALKVTVMEMASRLGVSRQTIYDWQNGKAAADREAKVDAIARAVDIVEAAGVPLTAFVLNRKIAEGKTLTDFVFEGGGVERAVGTLVQTLQREAEQRILLDSRLAKTKQRPITSSDYGTPAFDEGG